MKYLLKKPASLVVTTVLAVMLPSLIQANFYLGSGYGQAEHSYTPKIFYTSNHCTLSTEPELSNGSAVFEDKTGQAFLTGGYQFSPYLSLQLRYSSLSGLKNNITVYKPSSGACQPSGDLTIGSPAFSPVKAQTEIDAKSLLIRVRLDYPVMDRFIVSGLIGHGYLFQKSKMTFIGTTADPLIDKTYENGWNYGVATRYQLTPQFAIGAEWMKENLGSIDLESTNLTLEYGFK